MIPQFQELKVIQFLVGYLIRPCFNGCHRVLGKLESLDDAVCEFESLGQVRLIGWLMTGALVEL